MKPGSWKVLSSAVHADCRIFTVHRSRRKSTLSGIEHDFYTIEGYDWVNVIPVTSDGHLVLVRQFRHGVGEFTLELPGGAIHPGEDPVTGGLRELEEETGYRSGSARLLGKSFPNPAIQSNTCYYLLAEDCLPSGQVNPDPAEEIEIVLMPRHEIRERLLAGEFSHALVMNGLFLWLNQTTSGNHGTQIG